MNDSKPSDIIVTGVGVTSAIGQGNDDFLAALLQGEHRFDWMRRPGRQLPEQQVGDDEAGDGEARDGKATAFIGAEIEQLVMPACAPRRELRTSSLSAQVALASVAQAWQEAALDEVDPSKIGLVVGGSNVQQRELVNQHDKFRDRIGLLRPTYAMAFMDSDICGLCTQTFGITGMAYTMGGASASGQLAFIEAVEAVQSGRVDVCIAVGALMDLSYWECQGFRSLGAMGSDKFAATPELACRPFDQDRNGFIYGENCGVLVVEKASNRTTVTPYARVAGWGMAMDAHRNPDPSFDGEVAVIQQALAKAQINATQIDYINPHGTGSTIGDIIELEAIKQCGLTHAAINSTKSITGHGLSSAGSVELVATLLQMKAAKLHPCRNLDNPMADDYQWIRNQAVDQQVNYALKMSMGFGGVNSAVCLQNLT